MASMNCTSQYHFDIVGAFEIGSNVSLVLLGVLGIQTYYYFEHYPNDRYRIKALVGIIFVVEILHSFLTAHSLYQLTVNSFCFPPDLPWSVKVAVVCSSFVDFTFESYYAYRIRIVSQRWEFPSVCWVVASLRFACNIAAVILVFKLDLSAFVMTYKNLITAPLLAGLVLNLAIAAVLTHYIFNGGRSLPSARPTLSRCILFSIESGLITCLLILVMLTTAWIKLPNLIWLAMHFIITKTNSNSILVTLNSRHSLSTDPTIALRHQHSRPIRPSQMPRVENIVVDKTEVTHREHFAPYDRSSLTSQFEDSDIGLAAITAKHRQR